jgi:hypothetical protein
MRCVGVLALVLVTIACATTVQAQGPSSEPVGTLAELMRGIAFPASNRISDVQSVDPASPEFDPENPNDTRPQSRFSQIYTGWPTVDSAAIALAEVAKLMMIPGRLCENGEPVPVEQDNYIQWARELEEVGIAALEASRSRSVEAVIEVNNDIFGACSNCHGVYRDSYTDPPKARCVP